MKVSRRQFLKMGAQMVGGGLLVYTAAPRALEAILEAEATGKPAQGLDQQEHYWAFVVDVQKCIGCYKCLQACKLENGVPPGAESRRTWVETYGVNGDSAEFAEAVSWGPQGPESILKGTSGRDGESVKSFFMPKLCNQCANPPCVKVCPVSATFATQEGVVLVDERRCIGCKYCIQACPYGARYVNPETKTVDKCTWCYHRVTKGVPPACVEVCPVGARLFGDLKDPDSPVRKVIRERMTQVLKPALGTKPRVHYVGLQEGVQ